MGARMHFKTRGVCRKFATRPKNLPLIINLNFCSDQADILPKSPTKKLIILTKFHDFSVKTVDFLVIANFGLVANFRHTPLFH